ncbi:MAG: hypothetical protein M0Z52_03835 [Actinomycetota bacterium]|nr:hypothetical protein [Actinomycetota bacterium]
MISFIIRMTPDMGTVIAGIAGDIKAAELFAMTKTVMVGEREIKAEEPVRTGNLVNSTQGDVIDGLNGVIKITAPYGKYVYEGTGIYGPHGTPIVPVTAKALFWPGAPHPFRSVKGQKPNRFIDRALIPWNPQGTYENAVTEYLAGHR